MRRRTFLRGAGGTLGLAGVAGGAGRVAGGAGATGITGVTRTTDGAPFEPLGSVDIEGAKDAAVHHDGAVAYVAAGDGFVSVDLSTPSHPQVIAERREIDTGGRGPFREVWDVWPWRDRLVVAGPATVDPEVPRGFALFDISDPENPEQVAFHSIERDGEDKRRLHVHNTYFVDDMVYLTGSGLDPQPLIIVDVSDDSPEEVNRWALTEHEPAWTDISQFSRILHDIYVRNGVAYLSYWDAGTWLVDVSDPTAPEVLSIAGGYTPGEMQNLEGERKRVESLIPPGNHHYGQVDENGEILVVGVEAWAVETDEGLLGGPGGVKLYDVSEKTKPEHLATIDAPASFNQSREGWFTTAHNADIVGDRLYTSWYFGGVKVHDISDPGNPEELTWWRDPREATFWTAQSAVPGETFVGTSAGNIGAELGVTSDIQQTRGALYVFPDRAGTQQNAPDLTTPPKRTGNDGGGTDDGTDGESSTNDGGEGSTGDEREDDGNATAVDGTDANGTDTNETNADADDDGPGFGIEITLVGVGYMLARRLGRDSED